jgi:hypothetical protein
MAREIVTEIKVYDDVDEPADEVVVYFSGAFVERNFESFNDELLHFSRAELIELRDKITEAL